VESVLLKGENEPQVLVIKGAFQTGKNAELINCEGERRRFKNRRDAKNILLEPSLVVKGKEKADEELRV